MRLVGSGVPAPCLERLPVPCLERLPGPCLALFAVRACSALPVLCLGTFANALPGERFLPGLCPCALFSCLSAPLQA